MSLLLNTNGDPSKFQAGTYSRLYRSGNQQFRLFITFMENGVIKINHKEVISSNQSSILKYKDFGQVLRIHEQGETNGLAYYSFFYSDRLLHLCALTDDNFTRKLVLNGSWRRETESVETMEEYKQSLSVSA
jgi:hypothetical protein